MHGSFPEWKLYIKTRVFSVINSWIGRIFILKNKGILGEL